MTDQTTPLDHELVEHVARAMMASEGYAALAVQDLDRRLARAAATAVVDYGRTEPLQGAPVVAWCPAPVAAGIIDGERHRLRADQLRSRIRDFARVVENIAPNIHCADPEAPAGVASLGLPLHELMRREADRG